MTKHQSTTSPVSLFCVAASTNQDTALLAQWEKHLLPLQQAGLLTFWSKQHIQAGNVKSTEISVHLDQATCVVLLLSPDFFADDNCLDLMQNTLLRQQEGRVRLMVVLVRPSIWHVSKVRMVTYLPTNGVPITSWDSPEEGWQQAAIGLQSYLRLPSHSNSLFQQRKGVTVNRERMLHRLNRTYQASIEDALQGVTWMELGLSEHPDAVHNAIHLLQFLPNRTKRIFPIGTSILSVYDQAEGELLILGEPGAGKSTLLLNLAQQLLIRASIDTTHPLPVIVPLSSWAIKQTSIIEWLVEQLAQIYDVPRKLGQQWVDQNQILALLDGLDEIEESVHSRCIKAINLYHTEHFMPLVICSRKAEYDAASIQERLILQDAVTVQALTDSQVESSMHQGGRALSGLYEIMLKNKTLRELTTTPLMLNVLQSTYHDVIINQLPQEQTQLEGRVWADYVKRMVRQKGTNHPDKTMLPTKRFSLTQTYISLSWLAQQMLAHKQTIFYGEYLQESWLPLNQQRVTMWLFVRLSATILGGLTGLLFSFFFVSTTDPTILCQVGLLGGFLGWNLNQDHKNILPISLQQWRCNQRQFPCPLGAILLGLLAATSSGLSLSSDNPLAEWLQGGSIAGTCLGISVWLLQFRLTEVKRFPTKLSDTLPHWLKWLQTSPGRQAVWIGIILGIGVGMNIGLRTGLQNGLHYGLGDGLSYGLSYGLVFGVTSYLMNIILNTHVTTFRLAERIHWTWRPLFQRNRLWASLALSSIYGGLFVIAIGLGLGLGLDINLKLSLIYTLGTSLGLGVGYWSLSGLYQGVIQEHMEDHDRRHFNQGLHRSLRNTALLSLLSTSIITFTVLLGDILTLHLSALLNSEQNYGLSYVSYMHPTGWLIAICGWLVILATTGGFTILRHYLIRILLTQNHTFPWQAKHFLDDATARVLLRRVGGGYSFIHRQLLDYFAAHSTLPNNVSKNQTGTSHTLKEDVEG